MAPKKPSTFPKFSALPAELRLAIWNLSCQPRVVEVWYDTDVDRCRTTTRPPAVLQVNQEARYEALSIYRRAFATRSASDYYIYFSPLRDVLYLPRHGLMGYDDTARDFTVHVRDTAEHVRALAIDHVRTETIRPWEPYNKLMLILSFPNLQETMLVVGNGESGRTVRRRSQDSAASIASNASNASSTNSVSSMMSGTSCSSGSSTGAKSVEVQLVDPQGDTALVMGVIDNVIESFSREIQATGSAVKDNCDNRIYPHMPSLIPKAKAYYRRRHKRRFTIGCA